MKLILIFCTVLTSIMLLSFQQQEKIVRLENGNYFAKTPVRLSDADIKTLNEMTKKGKATTIIIHNKIDRLNFGETVVWHGEKILANQVDEGNRKKIDEIMLKYLR